MALYRPDESTVCKPRVSFDRDDNTSEPHMPMHSTHAANDVAVTQHLRDRIGELGSQIGESIANRLLASQNTSNSVYHLVYLMLEVEEVIDEHQRESESPRAPSVAKPWAYQVSAASLNPGNAASDIDCAAVNAAACVQQSSFRR